MRRIFWLAVGLGAGATTAVMAGRWVRRQARALAPASLAHNAGRTMRDTASLLGQAGREFREGMAEREAEVRASLGDV
jgi:hypothetical protein